jgi:hypothetical protein
MTHIETTKQRTSRLGRASTVRQAIKNQTCSTTHEIRVPAAP